MGLSASASATGFTDLGQDIVWREETSLKVDGGLRLRAAALRNLDLDRGFTPSGDLLYPLPLSDLSSQTLTHADLRLRSDLSIFAPGEAVAVRLRVDVLDNEALGGSPDRDPASSTTQVSPLGAVRVKRAYGEAVTPVGLVVAGRTGNHWGLGMLANGGDCPDCDSGDAADRVAFISPFADHIWAVSYDFSAIGPTTRTREGQRALDLDPADDVTTVTGAVLHWDSDQTRARRREAGLWGLEYGAYVSHRWQDRDVPAAYLPTATPVGIDGSQSVARGYRATAGDLWVRVTGPQLRVELEAAVLSAKVDQISLLPGVELRDGAESLQAGAALESLWGDPDEGWAGGLDAGFASGDPAPGFGAFEGVNAAPAQAGDLEGPQANPPYDNRADNFRFHPDYRVDRILFREILGTVTDAVYVRPHGQLRVRGFGAGTLTLSVSGVVSRAVEPNSTPSGEPWLGVELDPTVAYQSRDGFGVALEHGVLFPLGGLDNPQLGLTAKSAQLVRLRLEYLF
jgi:uncharacterized protein (TIGR04551 family)